MEENSVPKPSKDWTGWRLFAAAVALSLILAATYKTSIFENLYRKFFMNAVALNDRGESHLNNGKIKISIADFSFAIKKDSNFLAPYKNRAKAYFKDGSYGLAIEDLNKAISIDPNDAKIYFDRGNAYDSLGQIKLAIKDYSKAISITPKYNEAYYKRGVGYTKMMEYELAINDLETSYKLGNNEAKKFEIGNKELGLWRESQQRARLEKLVGGKIANIKELYDKLSRLEYKGRYETTKQVKERVEKFTKRTYVFKASSGYSRSDYNADKGVLSIPVISEYRNQINVLSYSGKESSHLGTNVFGVTKTFSYNERSSYGFYTVNLKKVRRKLRKDGCYYSIILKLSQEKAKKIEHNIGLLCVCKLVFHKKYPQLDRIPTLTTMDSYEKTPTITDTTSYKSRHYLVFANLLELIVYDNESGHIYKRVLKQIKNKYKKSVA